MNGYWIDDSIPMHTGPYFKCSVCGGHDYDEYDYCHHCGAKMIKGEFNMTNNIVNLTKEITFNDVIIFCRKKLNAHPIDLTGKRREGYEQALQTVMSYCHSEKKKINNK